MPFQSRLAGWLRNGPRTVRVCIRANRSAVELRRCVQQERPSFRALPCVKKLGRFTSYGKEYELTVYTRNGRVYRDRELSQFRALEHLGQQFLKALNQLGGFKNAYSLF